jgi:hypothetical protein
VAASPESSSASRTVWVTSTFDGEIAVQLAGAVQRAGNVDELDQRADRSLGVDRRGHDLLAAAPRGPRASRAGPEVDENDTPSISSIVKYHSPSSACSSYSATGLGCTMSASARNSF